MLEVTDLQASYGSSQVLFGVTFSVGDTEVVTLLGRNGMGKTTVIRSIMGILPSSAGEIRFDGRPIHRLRPYRIARLGLGLVPEGRQIFPNLTVRENLVATASANGGKSAWPFERVLDLFPPLAERSNSMGRLLSGGEQQMLAIGRALMTNPRLLILDEATEGLAPIVRGEIWRCIERLKHVGQSILIVDKNIKALARVANRHYFIEKGRIVLSCNSDELRAQPALRDRYIGV